MPVKKITPDVDTSLYSEFEFQGEAYRVKKKFKVARFLKTLSESPVDAIEIALDEDSYERFLDLEITMDELKEFLEGLSNALSGASLKN